MIEELRAARWFGGKNRIIRQTRTIDRADWTSDACMRLVQVEYASGPAEVYVVAERLEEPRVARELLERFHGAEVRTESGGSLVFQPTHILGTVSPSRLEPVLPLRGEQSNTSVRFDDALILKLFRRLQFGPNPDVEVGLFLTEHTGFRGTPPVAGSITYVAPDSRTAALAMLQGFEANRGDAWTTTLARVRRVLEGDDLAESTSAAARLGQTTAELHLALASGRGDFAAEPITDRDIVAWLGAIDAEVGDAAHGLESDGIHVETAQLLRRAHGLASLRGTLKTRHHGDYHLGQVLEREDGSFAIIDFEGEPAKPLSLRREKRSPLRDVAGMLRSFDYARHSAVRAGDDADGQRSRTAAEWYAAVRAAFMRDYLATARRLPELLPANVDPPLAALELEKAAYEVLYELNNRPDWVPIPLAALNAA